jgi:hypothetical protein
MSALLGPARDRRDLGGAPAPGELVVALKDDEGQPTTADALWAALAADAPAGLALDEFSAAVKDAVESAAAGDVPGVLALEPAFDTLTASARALARSLEGKR